MAKTRARQGKLSSAIKKPKKRGPSSSDKVRKTKTMDAIIGIEPVEFSEEEENDDSEQANRSCATALKEGNPITPPILRSGNVVRNLENTFKNTGSSRKVKITLEDIEDEVHFWSPSIVCYVLGSNPPLSVIEGFIRRFWKGKVDKVGALSYGVFLVRFDSIETRDEILNGGYVFFNNRPVVMKAWDSETSFKKEDIRLVPIWIQLPDLELKYWGEKSLFKIVGQLGKPLQVDEMTKARNKLNYPRVLVEADIQQDFPARIPFEDEYGYDVYASITYEWKPIICQYCKGLGHATVDCKKKTVKEQKWVIKGSKGHNDPAVTKSLEENSDVNREADVKEGDVSVQPVVGGNEGFKEVMKGSKVRGKEVLAETHIANSYNALEGLSEHGTDVLVGAVTVTSGKHRSSIVNKKRGGSTSSWRWIK
ncbi:uncharacterized protein LOC133034207 [Cannabis sativa]|uniref:uncharacterized protein LOC133034207 n=1 Tax=Cannabis sativa TaxID=3483 RepID=UPI0029CA385F|nr:uncharacterized protein LOC133034207 [Cannabis sativa]